MTLSCGIDVGGTKILGGVVDEDGAIVEELRVESPATDAEQIEKAIEQLVTELKSRHEIVAVGVGAAGYIDKNPSNKPEDRKFAASLMTVHLMFWAVLVIIGSFFRGPGFNFYLPWTDRLYFEL